MDILVEDLDDDVSSYAWYDALGPRVHFRRHDLPELIKRLEGLAENRFQELLFLGATSQVAFADYRV